jgi:hypothetical protein
LEPRRNSLEAMRSEVKRHSLLSCMALAYSILDPLLRSLQSLKHPSRPPPDQPRSCPRCRHCVAFVLECVCVCVCVCACACVCVCVCPCV